MRFLITIALVMLCSHSLMAGDFWMALGGGGGSKGLAYYGGASVQVDRHVLMGMRLVETRAMSSINEGRDGWFDGPQFSESAREFSFCLGWILVNEKEQKSLLSASLGIGAVTITEKGDRVNNWLGSDYWSQVENTTTGLALQSQMFFGKFGFIAFANVNSLESFGGLVISWRFLKEV